MTPAMTPWNECVTRTPKFNDFGGKKKAPESTKSLSSENETSHCLSRIICTRAVKNNIILDVKIIVTAFTSAAKCHGEVLVLRKKKEPRATYSRLTIDPERTARMWSAASRTMRQQRGCWLRCRYRRPRRTPHRVNNNPAIGAIDLMEARSRK